MAVEQQQAYNLVRRSYRMRLPLVDKIDEYARKQHVSRSKLINDLLQASVRYCVSGDTLPLREMREAFERSTEL